jgi:hypothetical protein
MVGNIGMAMVIFGLIAFFIGIFGGPRIFALVGVITMVASLAAFFIEEQQDRRAAR